MLHIYKCYAAAAAAAAGNRRDLIEIVRKHIFIAASRTRVSCEYTPARPMRSRARARAIYCVAHMHTCTHASTHTHERARAREHCDIYVRIMGDNCQPGRVFDTIFRVLLL